MVQNHPKMAQFSSHFGPCMTTKRPYGRKRLQARGPQKAQKQSKTAFFGNLMHRIASLSPCLRYRIQIGGHWHHYNGFAISKKHPPFFCENHGFGGTRDLSKSTAYMDLYGQKVGYVRSRTTERIVTWELIFSECVGENTSK